MTDAVLPPAKGHRLWLPILLVGIPVIILLVRIGLEIGEVAPRAFMPLFMVQFLSIIAAVLLVPVWFLFLSRFSIYLKVIGLLSVVLIIAVLVSITRKVEFSGSMAPIWVFNWDPDPQAELDKHREKNVTEAKALDFADLEIGATDYPRYRGPNCDGVAPYALPAAWTFAPKLVWKHPAGGGYAGFAVAGKVAVTIEQRRDQEVIVCYDRKTGKELWIHEYRAEFKQSENMGGGGPRATPAIADGDIYSLGGMGHLVCLEGTTGKPRWSRNVLADNGAKNPEWGLSSSPLIVREMVVINAGIDPDMNQKKSVAAYDRKTGTPMWASGSHEAGYSSPQLVTLAGVEQILLFDGGGLVGIEPSTGKELWRHSWPTFHNMNIIQPLVLPGDRIFISGHLDHGSALVKVTKTGEDWKVDQVWESALISCVFANPVHIGEDIYCLSKGFLSCFDAQTGKRKWRERGFGAGQVLLSGSFLIAQTEQGEIVAIQPDPAVYKELGHLMVFDFKTWNTPALAGGELYLRNHKEMACVRLVP